MTCIKCKLNKIKIPEQNNVHNNRTVADYKSQTINHSSPSKFPTHTFAIHFWG